MNRKKIVVAYSYKRVLYSRLFSINKLTNKINKMTEKQKEILEKIVSKQPSKWVEESNERYRIRHVKEEKECTHYDWYNDEDGKMYCSKCNKHIGQLER